MIHDVVFKTPNTYSVEATIVDNSSMASRLFAAMEVQPSEERKQKIIALIDAVGDIIATQDFFYIVGETPQQSLINWVNPGKHDGSPVIDQVKVTTDHPNIMDYFIPDKGFKQTETSTFCIDTNYRPHYEDSKARFNNCAGGAVCTEFPTGSSVLFGWNSPLGYSWQITLDVFGRGTNRSKARLFTGSSRVFTSASTEPSHWYITRTPEDYELGQYMVYRDVALVQRAPHKGTEPIVAADRNMMIMTGQGVSDDGTVDYPTAVSNHRNAVAFFGAGLSYTQIETLHYALNEFLASIGAIELQVRPVAKASIAVSPKKLSVGNEVTYTLKISDIGTTNGSLTATVSGDVDDTYFDKSFEQSILDAIATESAVSYSNGIFTFTEDFIGSFSWKRTFTSNTADILSHEVTISEPTGLYIDLPYCTAITGNPLAIDIPNFLYGVNFSGAEFGGNNPFYGTDASIQVYEDIGTEIIRLPYLWERLQPEIFGEFSIVGNGTGQAEKYKNLVEACTNRGIYCIIEPHDYGRRKVNGVSYKIGTPLLKPEALLDHWSRMIDFIGHNPYVIYNFMNEPNGISGDLWWGINQALCDLIRAKGYYNKLHIPGISYTGAHSWISSGNAAKAELFVDPINNYDFEVHQYLDPGSDGSGDDAGVCALNSANRIDAITTWARTNGYTLFLGEFAAGDPAKAGQEQCAIEFPNMLNKIEAAKDVWSGTAVWGAGPYWNATYPFRFFKHESNGGGLSWIGEIITSYWPAP